MSKILVKFYTTLKDRLGTSKLWLDGSSVGDVLSHLRKKPGIEEVLFDGKGIVRGHFVLTLNSKILDSKKTGKTRVSAGDILHIFPPVSGG